MLINTNKHKNQTRLIKLLPDPKNKESVAAKNTYKFSDVPLANFVLFNLKHFKHIYTATPKI